ncbi:MAG: TonB-dependent receptor, partial [Bacteroidia bacterium]|nr:TonB-dependent receptor [Bacteroidia bacterium]
PFLPTYYDAQSKVEWKINPKTTASWIFIGAIDRFSINRPEPPDPAKFKGEDDPKFLEEQSSFFDKMQIFQSIPIFNQNSYSTGFTFKRLTPRGFYNIVLSRNLLRNMIFLDTIRDDPSTRIQDFNSLESENKLRVHFLSKLSDWEIAYGATFQHGRFTNESFLLLPAYVFTDAGWTTFTQRVVTDNELNLFKYGAYGSVSRAYFKNRLKTTFGLRVDMNSFTTGGNNPLQTLSPRGAASFALDEKWSLNASMGYYAKLPPYTLLGFGNGVNRDAKYIKSLHYVFGGECTPKTDWTISAEAFLKFYYDYPVSLLDGVSLANKGGGFGVFGNEPVVSNGRGRTWGLELFTQKLLTDRIYGLASYTLFFTNFDNGPGTKLYRAAWDNRHLVSVAGGYLLGKNKTWELAAKFRLLGGAPYTPFDTSVAAREYFLLTGRGVPDRNRFNEAETAVFSQLDVRVDKKFFFKKWSLNVFIDIQNVYAARNPGIPNFDLERDRNGAIIGAPDPGATRVRNVALDSSNIIPSFGLRVKF